MAENENMRSSNVPLAVAQIGLGIALVVVGLLSQRPKIEWLVGWALFGTGGWLIPQRFVSGMFVGAAVAMELMMLLILYG